ncbi:ATPase [Solibacillus silvestris]|uniref:ATPase n=1 Tax=Solibacillus silvestris TaxID=76853 RepID=UPI003F7E275D
MKSWQIIFSGFLPYVVAVFVFISYTFPYANESMTFGAAVTVVLYVLPAYCFVIVPWYYLLYMVRKHFNKRAFFLASLLFCVVQPIIISIFLKVKIGGAEFWLFVSPPLIIGILIFTLCINRFFKANTEHVTNGRGEAIEAND